MTYERFERHFDPSLAIDEQIDKSAPLGVMTELSPETQKAFELFESRLARKIPELRTKDIDDPAWTKLLTPGYEIVEDAVKDGSVKIPTSEALNDIEKELREMLGLRKGGRGLKIYSTRGTPFEMLGFGGFVSYEKIRVPFEYHHQGQPEMGFAHVLIGDIPSSDTDAAKYRDIIQKTGRSIFREILRQQQIRKQPKNVFKGMGAMG